MSTLDKEKVDEEYSEAIAELQSLYDGLFYDDIKAKVNEILQEIQGAHHALENETKKTVEETNGYLTIIKEDIEKAILHKHRDALSEISQWLHRLNGLVNAQLDKKSNALLEKMNKDQKYFDDWKAQVNKQLEDQLRLAAQYKEQLVSQLDKKGEDIVAIQKEEMKLEIKTIEGSLSLKYQQLEASSKKEVAELKQQLLEIKDQSEKGVFSLTDNIDARTNKLKGLLYGVFVTQILLIVMGIVLFL